MRALVGLISETKEAHLRRHGGGLRACPRCHFYRNEQAWRTAFGNLGESARAGPRAVCWLSERPARWGGTWGLGCRMCADSAARASCLGVVGSARRRLGSAWARYEARPLSLQSEHLRQHCECDAHRVAVLAWLRPDAPPNMELQRTLDDDRLLAGAVPQPPDWLRAWNASRTPQSWQAAAQAVATEHFIRQARERSVGARPLEKMARIMVEVVRAQKRELLRRADSIALSFDDRAGYKLIRFRATSLSAVESAFSGTPPGKHAVPLQPGASPDAPQGTGRASPDTPLGGSFAALGGIASEGILGCLQTLRGAALDEWADDYAQRAAKEILALLDRFCTPLAQPKDDALVHHILARVHSIVADGALQKVAAILRAQTMPGVLLIQRDPAHFIRIACRDPLIRTGNFENQHARLFGKRGLFRNVQFSDSLQARLEACQKVVLGHRGAQGGGVAHIMRHFSFAPHRFESWTAPRRKLACALHAVALLLAEIAGDQRRQPKQRKEAEELLQWLTPPNLLELGLAADFGEICMRSGVPPRGLFCFASFCYRHRLLDLCFFGFSCQQVAGRPRQSEERPRMLNASSTRSFWLPSPSPETKNPKVLAPF